MKRYTLVFIAILLLQMLNTALAHNKWNDTKGIFKYQKDVDGSVSAVFTRTMATITFGDKLFNFVNYRAAGYDVGKIILRIMHNDGSSKSPWSFKKYDDIKHLKNLGGYDWQPAPVIFNNQLYLFVGDVSLGISYSIYNEEDNSWSKLIPTNITEFLGCGMAATVVDGKLCLVAIEQGTQMSKGYPIDQREVMVYWTEDLESWQRQETWLYSKWLGLDAYSHSDVDMLNQLTAITIPYVDNGIKKEKCVFGYINENYNPHTSGFYFNEENEFTLDQDKLITTENHQSIVLIAGTVNGDAALSGRCVQAFIKKKNTEKGWLRYRIQRYQSVDGGDWTLEEKNIVPQNLPKKMWASQRINLTAAVLPVSHNGIVKQEMCLVYRGYDDWDYPLNCAWTETDNSQLGGNEITLPADVSGFSAANTEYGVKLNWKTLLEIENYGFQIERISDNTSGNWETIGFVEGAGNCTSAKEYSFTDSDPIVGKSSYRLKQINTEMNFVYSSNVEIEVEPLLPTEFAMAQNYPNPFNPTTNISFTVPSKGHAVLRVYNPLGQEVAQLFNGEAQAGTKNQVSFNASHLSSGTYFSRLEYDGKVLLKKMLLIK